MKELLLCVLVILSVLAIFSNGSSLNLSIGKTTLTSWMTNQTIHYRYNNETYTPFTSIHIGPITFNFTEIYNNFFYNETYNENVGSVGTIYRLGTVAYPQNFVVSMIDNGFPACSSKSQAKINGSSTFFSVLCGIYNTKMNVSFYNSTNQSEINNSIKEIVAETMPNDVFTKELYGMYYNYSSACDNQGSDNSAINGSVINNDGIYELQYESNKGSAITLTNCQGSSINPALPYFSDYVKYIDSLAYFMGIIYNYSPKILYDSIFYDMKDFNVFPTQKTPELIQNKIALMGVYPGMIPSGLDSEEMLNNSQIGLPINYFKDNNVSSLTKNGVNITSGVYNNITIFTAYKNLINNYSFYNISPTGYPFDGNLSTGYIVYADTCVGGMGKARAEKQEYREMVDESYNKLVQYNLYPLNQYSNMSSFGNQTYYSYGPSIIKAIPSNIIVNYNKILYGASYYNKSLAYENSTNVNFTSNQALLSLKIPTNAIKYPQNLRNLFAKMLSNYSYKMNYYGFNEEFSKPVYSTYSVNRIVGGKVSENCITSYIAAKMNYTSNYSFIGSKNNNYSTQKESYVNVSTNISVKNVFNTNSNGYPVGLNYSYTLYKSSSPQIKSFSNITIPSGTAFQVFSLNNSPLEEFTASYGTNTTITGSGSKNLFLYAPTYVFPDIYQGITYYYPTISSYANNNEYLTSYESYEIGLGNNGGGGNGWFGLVSFFIQGAEATISHVLNKTFGVVGVNITNTPEFQIISGEHQTEEYYIEGCPYTKIGNVCVAPPLEYVLNNKDTQSQSDFNLLNPILYTQNMYYLNSESTFWICTKVDFWKTVLSVVYPSVNNWTGCKYAYNINGINELFFTNLQLIFNESWKNFTSNDTVSFYKYLENNSTYSNYTYYGNGVSGKYSSSNEEMGKTGIYSTVFPPTLFNGKTSVSIKNNVIINRSTNFNISGAYSGMRLNECVYSMCYSTDIFPTKIYTLLHYSYVYVGNETFKVSVYPNEYNKESLLLNNTISDPVSANLIFDYSLGRLNTTAFKINFTAPSTFYIKDVQSSNTGIKYSNGTLYVYAPEFTTYIITMSFNKEYLPPVLNGSFNFLILNQTLTMNSYVSTSYSDITWLEIIFVIIIIIILWRTRYLRPLKDEISYRINSLKEKY